MKSRIFDLPYCSDCGEVRVAHPVEKITQYLDDVVSSNPDGFNILRFTEGLLRSLASLVRGPEILLAYISFLVKIGAIEERLTPAKVDTTRTLALYEGAVAAGVTLRQFLIKGNSLGFIAEKQVAGRLVRVPFKIIPRPIRHNSRSLTWMDNKGVLKRKLQEAGLPCADGGMARNEKEAVALFRKLGRPVIAKPHQGSRGRHTTLDIRDEEGVRKGFRIAAQLSHKVIIEAYLHGTVHRVTLVGGKPVAVAKREYPHVVGDGIHTVDELLAIENKNPLRDGVFYRKIEKNDRADAALEKQGLSWTSIPEKGRSVILNDKNSRLHGAVTEDVTDVVHPDNMELFTNIGTFLGDPIVGVDFMMEDMRRSWKEQPDAGLIECNSMPFIDVHHKVISGRTVNVAEYLWNEVFKEK